MAIRKVQNKKGYFWLADGYIDGKRVKRRFDKKADAEGFAAYNVINHKSKVNNAPPNPFKLFGLTYGYDVGLVNRPLIYFVYGNGAVKIGFSTNFIKRFSGLNLAVPNHLEILGVIYGGPAVERNTQKFFKRFHIKGEWYVAAVELLDYIKEHAKPSPLFQIT